MKSQGQKNKEVYDFYYKKGKMKNKDIYDQKIYNMRFTDEDKEKVNNSFAFRKSPMTTKMKLLFIILCILFLFFGYYSYENDDKITSLLFIIIFFFVSVAIYRDVNIKFYKFLLVIIIVILLIVSGLLKKGYNFTERKLRRNNINSNNNINIVKK